MISLLLAYACLDVWSAGEAATGLASLATGGNARAEASASQTTAWWIVFPASAVALLFWLHRASRCIHALSDVPLRFTPGWAVGWFFVPVMNVLRPYQVVAELWRRTSPADSEPRTSVLVLWWWLVWLAPPIIAGVGFAGLGLAGIEPFARALEPVSERSPDVERLFLISGLVGAVSDFVATILAIAVVRGLSARIEARTRVAEQREFAAL